MKKFFAKYTFIALAACLLASCGDDDNYVIGEQEAADRPNVYFYSEQASDIEVEPTDPTEFDIPVYRSKSSSSQALTVPVEVYLNEGSVFTVPESVEFASGQTEAKIHVTYDKAEVGTTYKLIVDIPKDYVSLYKINEKASISYTTSVTRVKWDKVSAATVHSAWTDKDFETELQYSATYDKYRLYNAWGTNVNILFSWPDKGAKVKFDANAKSPIPTGFTHPDYGAVYWAPDSEASSYDSKTKAFTFVGDWIVYINASAGSFGKYSGTVTLHD